MEMNISANIRVVTKERCFWYKIYDLGPEKVFTIHSRGVFTQDKLGRPTNRAISPTVKYMVIMGPGKSVHCKEPTRGVHSSGVWDV